MKEEGIYSDIKESVIERIIGLEVMEYMETHTISKEKMAERIGISLTDLNCMLDQKKHTTLYALIKAADVLNREIIITIK